MLNIWYLFSLISSKHRQKMNLHCVLEELNKRKMFNKLNGIHSISLLKTEVYISIYS